MEDIGNIDQMDSMENKEILEVIKQTNNKDKELITNTTITNSVLEEGLEIELSLSKEELKNW